MRILSTWIGVLLNLFIGLLKAIRPFVIGHPNAHDPLWRLSQHLIFTLDLALFCCTISALIYLFRVKDKGTHEKIGIAVNFYWFAITAFGIVTGLLLPHIT